MEYKIRHERPADHREVERLVYEAFKDLELPGRTQCDEHCLLHKLRKSEIFIPELNFVAEQTKEDGTEEIVGQIVYARVTVQAEKHTEWELISFGPLAVLPQYQGLGIGEQLVRHSLSEAARLGYPGVLIFGHPGYYPRFGFENAETYGITTEDGENFDAFMARELSPGAMKDMHGRLLLNPIYVISPKELETFNAHFFA
ncbi:N-acetyltransferase [Ruminococcaceae bacterium OttesenSCG-928-I18]|nr:N-acetyltransferase [Ruminococcaceae bacterium OttesenSCG-928-I18]